MKLKDTIQFLDEKIPKNLAIKSDKIGFQGNYDLNQDINSIKIFMDLYPKYDNYPKKTLIITHHPPLFKPKTPTYTIHSNWDIIDGGSNEAVANNLNLEVTDIFDKATGIGRICKCNYKFKLLKENILSKYTNPRIVNKLDDNKIIKNVGIISGFGLKNPKYVNLANKNNLDILISGDLTQETAILAKNLNITLIDLGHHESEVNGLYGLKKIVDELKIECEIINILPIEKL